MRRTTRSAEDLRHLAAVARGEAPADLFLEGGLVLNVYSGEVLPANVAVGRGRIAYVGGRRTMVGPHTEVLAIEGRVLVPGYLEPHCHPGNLYNPVALASAVLPLGTTAVVADTLFALVHAVPERLVELLSTLSALPVRFYWFLRLHAQAHQPGEDAIFTPERLNELLTLETVRTVGEITRWPEVAGGDATLLARIATGLAAGRRVEGHAPGVSAERLQPLAAAGFSSDHEAITAEQALDRLRAGLYVMLRHSSIRLDLPELVQVAAGPRAYSGRLMLTADGPASTFIEEHGYIDHLIAVAIDAGIDPIAAYQMATLNPASYYGLDEELGGIAPGRLADINVLDDLRHPRPMLVLSGGRVVAEGGRLRAPLPDVPWDRYIPARHAPWEAGPELFAISGASSSGADIAMHLENAVITRRRDVILEHGRLPAGVQVVALLDPDGRWMCRTLLSGFADHLEGLACTFTTGSGLTVIGNDPQAMSLAARRALELGGGIVLVERGESLFELPLPIAGLMSREPLTVIAAGVRRLEALLRDRGYAHDDIAYTLLFLSFDSLPDLRLTHRGLWDVKAQQVLLPRRDLPLR